MGPEQEQGEEQGAGLWYQATAEVLGWKWVMVKGGKRGRGGREGQQAGSQAAPSGWVGVRGWEKSAGT